MNSHTRHNNLLTDKVRTWRLLIQLFPLQKPERPKFATGLFVLFSKLVFGQASDSIEMLITWLAHTAWNIFINMFSCKVKLFQVQICNMIIYESLLLICFCIFWSINGDLVFCHLRNGCSYRKVLTLLNFVYRSKYVIKVRFFSPTTGQSQLMFFKSPWVNMFD